MAGKFIAQPHRLRFDLVCRACQLPQGRQLPSRLSGCRYSLSTSDKAASIMLSTRSARFRILCKCAQPAISCRR